MADVSGAGCGGGAAAAFQAILAALGKPPGGDDPDLAAVWRLVAGVADGASADPGDATARAVDPQREGATVRFAVQDAIVAAVEAWLAAGPTVLALDDLHWADVASVATLAALFPLTATAPLLMVLTSRNIPHSPELHTLLRSVPAGTERLQLGPLDLAAAADIVLLSSTHLDRGAAQAVAAEVGGNPFLLAAAAAQRDAGASRAVVAPVLGLLDGLGDLARRALRIAAVFGAPFLPEDLAAHLDEPLFAVIEALDSAVQAGVLVASGSRLEFVHDLVREAVDQQLPEPLRLGLQRAFWRAGQATGADPTSYIPHLVASAEVGDSDAVSGLREAAEQVLDTDPHLSAELLGRALELAKPLRWELRGALLCDRVAALRLANRPDDAVALAREAGEWPLGAAVLARIEYEAAHGLRFLGRLPESITWMERALGRAALPADLASWGWSFIVGSAVWSLAPGEQTDAALAHAHAEAARAGDELAAVQAICASSSAAWIHGRAAEARRLALDAVARVAGLGNVVWPAPGMFAALALLVHGDPVEAVAQVTPWGRLAERVGDLWALSRMEMVTALARFDLGDWDAVDAHADTIIRIGEETGGANGQPMAQALAGLIACRRGDLIRAMERSEAGHLVAESPCVDPAGLPFLGWLDAEIAWARGDREGGRVLLEGTYDVLAIAAPVAQVWLAAQVCRWALAAGEGDRAAQVAERAVALAAAAASPRFDRVAQHCAALVSGDTAALLEIATPETAWPYRYEAALLGLDLAGTLGAAGRHDDAAAWAARAEQTMVSLGVPPVPAATPVTSTANRPASASRGAGRPRFGLDSLTRAERAVLDLLAAGHTNSAIAGQLYLSKRTVESHVSRMYTKLGVTTRVELARLALTG